MNTAAPVAIESPFLFLVRTPAQIAGFIQMYDGKVCAIVENYAEVFEAPPVITDGASVVLAIEVDPDDVKVYQDGDKMVLKLWRGDKQSRAKPSDKLTLPFYSLEVAQAIITAGAPAAAVAPVDPVEAARTAFAEYPAEIQLAAALSAVPVETLATLPEISPARAQAILNWSQAQLATLAPPAAAAAGA
jgi:hypothetical protein